eukprot:UC1_evm2s2160
MAATRLVSNVSNGNTAPRRPLMPFAGLQGGSTHHAAHYLLRLISTLFLFCFYNACSIVPLFGTMIPSNTVLAQHGKEGVSLVDSATRNYNSDGSDGGGKQTIVVNTDITPVDTTKGSALRDSNLIHGYTISWREYHDADCSLPILPQPAPLTYALNACGVVPSSDPNPSWRDTSFSVSSCTSSKSVRGSAMASDVRSSSGGGDGGGGGKAAVGKASISSAVTTTMSATVLNQLYRDGACKVPYGNATWLSKASVGCARVPLGPGHDRTPTAPVWHRIESISCVSWEPRPLQAPINLLVENLAPGSTGGIRAVQSTRQQPTVFIGTTRPRFSFWPHAGYSGGKDTNPDPNPSPTMTAYRIHVRDAETNATVWDSGLVPASAAVGIRCKVELTALKSYTWTASWASSTPKVVATAADTTATPATVEEASAPTVATTTTATGSVNSSQPRDTTYSSSSSSSMDSFFTLVSSESSVHHFTIGPVQERDWSGAVWLGAGGQNEFRLQLNLDADDSSRGSSTVNTDKITTTTTKTKTSTPWDAVRIYVASPGGAVLQEEDSSGAVMTPCSTVSGDGVGISEWLDYTKRVSVHGHVLSTEGNATKPLCTEGAGIRASSSSNVTTNYTTTTSFSSTVQRTLRLQIGHGFWSPSFPLSSAFWGVPTGAGPVARILVTGAKVTRLRGRRGTVVADDPWQGAILDLGLNDNAGWTNTVPVPQNSNNVSLLYRPTGSFQMQRAPYASIDPVAVATRLPVHTVSVRKLLPTKNGNNNVQRWLYKFSRNIVGHAAVVSSHVTFDPTSVVAGVGGNLTLRHCENINATLGQDNVTCSALKWLPDQPDTYMFPAGRSFNPRHDGNSGKFTTGPNNARQSEQQLRALPNLLYPRFTWHGFQYVIVEATPGVHFTGAPDSLVARWTTSSLTFTSNITMTGPGSDTLNGIHDLVVASQLSNMAAFVPTDCPTREKHGWLGDAQVTAEEALYNLWAPGVFESFLDAIRASAVVSNTSQRPDMAYSTETTTMAIIPKRVGNNNNSTSSVLSPAATAAAAAASAPATSYRGFVASVVPGRTLGRKSPAFPGDISWTAAYPLIVRWMNLYYGDLAVVRDHWVDLIAWTDAQRREMAPSDAVPCFFVWGDWCAPDEPRSNLTAGTGERSAAANYILAVEAMVEMASSLNDTATLARYRRELASWRAAFHSRYYNVASKSYAVRSVELQTLNAVALGAGVVPRGHPDHNAALQALVADASGRNHHVTVGAVGQKWLLRELSASDNYDNATAAAAGHDEALRLATQTTFPSWGYWLAQGATTCWENWSGVTDQSHPGTPWPGRPGQYISPNPPTHNHIFLCGGVGEWLHRSLGGIAPEEPGYAVVRIAPRVSKTLGPYGANASVETVRGIVRSSWRRQHGKSDDVSVSGSKVNGAGEAKATIATAGRSNLSSSAMLPASSRPIFTMHVSVPSGSRAHIVVPLLMPAENAILIEAENQRQGGIGSFNRTPGRRNNNNSVLQNGRGKVGAEVVVRSKRVSDAAHRVYNNSSKVGGEYDSSTSALPPLKRATASLLWPLFSFSETDVNSTISKLRPLQSRYTIQRAGNWLLKDATTVAFRRKNGDGSASSTTGNDDDMLEFHVTAGSYTFEVYRGL